MKIFDNLNNSYALVDDELPVSILSNNIYGCTALAFRDKIEGEEFIKSNREFVIKRGFKNVHLLSIENSYEFMIKCSRNGLSGIELFEADDQESFLFGVRLEEAGAMFPSVLIHKDKEENGFSIRTRFKDYQEQDLTTVKPWERYDILDKRSSVFAEYQPFRDWNANDLYEIRTTNNEDLNLFNVPFMKSWNALDGSRPFFSNLNLAVDFLMNKEYMSHLMLFSGIESIFNEEAINISELTNQFKIIRINDLQKRLSELTGPLPFMKWVVNPNGQRDSQGYGEFSMLEGVNQIDINSLVYNGISGSWQLKNDNIFVRKSRRKSWEGFDTFYWNTNSSFRLNILDRSFSRESLVNRFMDWSNSDINDFIDDYFVDYISEEEVDFEIYEPIESEDKLDSYVIICWDTISGEGRDMPYFFESFLELLKLVWTWECINDYPARVHGLQASHSIGIIGSDNIDKEKMQKQKFKSALKEIIRKVILTGYKSEYGESLSSLINLNFKSLHIDAIGYCKDLLWQTENDEQREILNLLAIKEEIYNSSLKDIYMNIDSVGENLALGRIPSETWNKLHNRSKYFIASSLSKLSIMGSSPQLDYSGISIGFVKAVEFELGSFFRYFATTNDLTNVSYNDSDYGECGVINLFNSNNSRPPSLGQMGHLLRSSKKDESELRFKLISFIENLETGEYFTSKKFWKEAIYKITNKYRNGGAHDSAISEKTCLESLEFIIGNKDSVGVITKVLQWK